MYVIQEKEIKKSGVVINKNKYVKWGTPFAFWGMTYIVNNIEEAMKFKTMPEAYQYIADNNLNRKLYTVKGVK